ncbi:MAG TPA: hypothetical protein VFP49_11500 [Nitrososphaeraceae archaeon]|nr:hypothetical protein [Nitrososphaeraceae archaeon]
MFTKGKRILIIDDDEDINLFKLFLEYDGYNVDAFTDPILMLCTLLEKMYMILFYLI